MKKFLLFLLSFFPATLFAQGPTIRQLLPNHVIAGSPTFTITVYGKGLSGGSVKWNGASLTTTTYSDQVLTAVVPGADVAAIGTAQVTVNSSNGLPFQVLTPLAQVSRYVPDQFTTQQDTPITVYGQDFASNAVILFDWQAIPTTFVDPGTLTGVVPAALITSDVHHIQVYNGAFVGGSVTIVRPPALNAGTIAITGPASNSQNGFVIRDSSGTVTLGSPWFTITGANASDFSIAPSACSDGLVLVLNTTCQLVVAFNPTTNGAETATLTIFSDATNSPQSIPLSGTGSNALTIQANPGSLSFAATATGASQNLSFNVSNLFGSFSLSTPFEAITGTNAADFSVTGGSCSNGLTLPPLCGVTVTFAPSVAGSKTATLTISSGADNSPTTIPLSGVAQVPGAHSVKITWNTSTAAGIVGYNVYRAVVGSSFGSPLNGGTPVNALTYTDTTVTPGTTYLYGITAVGGQPNWPTGSESVVVQSNQVTP